MSFDLEEYVPETMAEGDKLKPSDIIDHPLIIKVLDYRTGITTKFSPNGDGEAVIVDVFDMSDQKIHLQVMWFNNAIRDNLKNKVGKVMPVRLVFQAPKKAGGNPYIIPVGLDGADLETARAWAKEKPTLFEDERTERDFGEYSATPVSPEPAAQAPAFSASAPSAAKPTAVTPPAAAPQAASTPAPAAQPPAASAPAAAADDDDDIPF